MSDSCVLQNKNSIMSYNMQSILFKNLKVERISMKYYEPRHFLIQEVDAIHRNIKRAVKNQEVYLPLDLVKKKLIKVKCQIHT